MPYLETANKEVWHTYANICINNLPFLPPNLYVMKRNKQPRRKFLQLGATGVVTALLGGIPETDFAQSTFDADKGIVVHEGEGQHIITGRRKVPITIKISKQQHGINGISFSIEEMTPGRKMRIHKHLYNDELIFIHKGEGTFTLGEESIPVKAGSVAFVPRGVWHGLDNTGQENLLMVFQYSPAGFEEYFIENGTLAGMPTKEKTEAEYAVTEKKYGMVYRDKA
jgi:mannose-6-phosphate isomerase-like protein (cupin superfamily)